MSLEITPSIDPDVQASILAKLAEIEAERGVRILFAIESGSRAWGFPSPDSDYDARFVYVQREDRYLTLAPGRDVIELPIEDNLDINGWDIKKALELLLKPNPVLLEWLSSPIRYRWSEDECRELIALAAKITHGAACLHHYLRLGERQWAEHIEGRSTVNLKKYFYVLRPALAIRWLRLRPETAPPMNFQALIAGIDLAPALQDLLLELVVAKSRAKELGEAPRLALIDAFINAEFDWAKSDGAAVVREASQISPASEMREQADALFRQIVRRPCPRT